MRRNGLFWSLALTFGIASHAVYAQMSMAGPKIAYNAYAETDGVHPGTSVRVAIELTLSEGWHVNSNKPLDEFLIPTVLTFAEDPAYAVEKVIYPEHKLIQFSFSPDKVAVYEQQFVLGAVVKLAADLSPAERTLKGTLQYQACNDKQCAPPAKLAIEIPLKIVPPDQPVKPQQPDLFNRLPWGTGQSAPIGQNTSASAETKVDAGDWRPLAAQFTVAGRLDGFADTSGFLAFLDTAETGAPPSSDSFAGQSGLWIVLLVLAGGLALNLTPCVLPLIPINIAIIGAGARAGSRKRGFALGAAYGAGIALVYGLLGLIVVLGVTSAFGSINATPWFNAAIALFFIALGLAMFDIIQIDFSKYQATLGIRKNESGSFVVAFAMGAISALLAGACVAPVVISTILHAQDLYSQGIIVGLALPFLLGVGMALPWPFMGAGLSFLPKPGKWMTRVKQAFGVFMIAFAAYYGHLAYSLYTSNAGGNETGANGWETSLEAGLAQAAAEQKTVIIDFWATWCKNCLVMDKITLQDPSVRQRLEKYVKVKFQTENLNDPRVKAVTEQYRVLGLPTYVILRPQPSGNNTSK